MWMHFVIYCSMEQENSISHRDTESEIAAFAHPGYKYPLESSNNFIIPSSPKGYQSNNLHISYQQCFFLKGTLAVNPFTNVNRLDVFRNLSRGEESQLLFWAGESSSRSSSVSSDCASAHGCSPAQISLDAGDPNPLAYPFIQRRLQSCFSSKKVAMINSLRAIRQPLHYDNSPTLCKGEKPLHIPQPIDIEVHNMAAQQRNSLVTTRYPSFNEKASTVSSVGLGCKATHLNCVVLSNGDHMTSFTGAWTVPNPYLLSHFEGRRSFEWEMGEITSLNTDNCAVMEEEKGTIYMDEEMKRSLHDLIDVKDTCPLFNNSPISLSEDTELFGCYLADTSFYFSPVSNRTPERNSSLSVDMASSTNISNVGSYSPSSVSSILRGSLKNVQSLDFNSHRRQGYGHQEQLQTKLRQVQTRSESILDQRTSQSQMWFYDI